MIKFRTAYLIVGILLPAATANAQTTQASFAPPMRIEPKLSANFGELRKNHFHSGLDYRTESKVGIPVYAAEEGYLVRIFVSPGGFGKALYLNHPNGYTTVYGHLDSFTPEIERYVRTRQYSEESFSINDFPNKSLFQFKKGDLIGYSGNSGASGGPHLHFEIRDMQTEETLNPLGNGYIYIADKLPPKIKNVVIYQQDTIKGVPVPSIYKEISARTKDTISVPKSFFVGIECADYMPNSANEYHPKRIEVQVDSLSVYLFDITKFAFDETRFINSVIDFEQFVTKKREIIRAYKEPNNTFSVLDGQKNAGMIRFTDGQPHKISVTVADNNGNETSSEIWVKGNASTKSTKSTKSNLAARIPAYYNKTNIIRKAAAKITIPGKSLYQSLLLDYKEEESLLPYSKVVTLGSNLQPLSKPFEIAIKAANIPEILSEKVFIARGTNSAYTSLGGALENGVVTTTSSEFGRFFVSIDTVAPTIKPRFTPQKNAAPSNGILNFTVYDDKTGVDAYDIYVDGKWVIGEYDPKYNLISLKLDEDRISKGKEHELEFYISDGVGNTNYFKCSFYF